jgi:hypothetical protein
VIAPLIDCFKDFNGDTAFGCNDPGIYLIFQASRYKVSNYRTNDFWRDSRPTKQFTTFHYPQDSAYVSTILLEEQKSGIHKKVEEYQPKPRIVLSSFTTGDAIIDSSILRNYALDLQVQFHINNSFYLTTGIGLLTQEIKSKHLRYLNQADLIDFGFLYTGGSADPRKTVGFFKFNISPIFSSGWKSANNKTPDAVVKSLSSLPAIFTLGMGITIGNLCDLSLEYKHIPYQIVISNLQENFLAFSLGFNLNRGQKNN